MATPKLDLVYDGFIRGIGSRWNTTFDPTSGMAIPDSKFIVKEIIPKYINQALWKLFDTVWMQLGGDVKLFIAAFPELVRSTVSVTFTAGEYSIANPYKDFKALVGARTDANVFLNIWSADKYSLVKSEKNRSYAPTASSPAIIQLNNALYCFPATTVDLDIEYVRTPVTPTTGEPLTQNGSYDMPFDYTRINTLIELAVEIFNKAAQESA